MPTAESLTSMSWTTQLAMNLVGGEGVTRASTSLPQGRQVMSALAQIAEAWRLHEAGALSLDEFTEMKRGLLASPPPVAPTPPRCWHQPPAIKAPGPKGHCSKAPGHLGGMGSHPPGACCSGCGASAASPPMRGELRLGGRRSRSLRIAPPQCRCR